MIDVSYCQTMAHYNQWMNQRLYALCGELTDKERKRDLGAFFKSIHGTLNHLLYGDLAWISRFTHQPDQALSADTDLADRYEDFTELRHARVVMDQQMLDWSGNLTTDWLARPYEYVSTVYQQTRILPNWLLVTHMFNHQTHHRGQLTTLLSQLGIDPGITDLPWMPLLEF